MKRLCRIAAALLTAFSLACLGSAKIAGALTRFVSVPLMRLLSLCSGSVPFPTAGFLLTALVLMALAIRGCRRALAVLLAALCLFTWIPPLGCKASPAFPAPSQSDTKRLCESLIEQLNASGRQTGNMPALLSSAQAAMDSPFAPKAARYPEWMRLLRLSGLYLPLTGEALVDPTRGAASLPFTAAHELAHARGIADECAANILAYESCVARGGVSAYSARLWALKYAAGNLTDAAWIERALDADIAADYAAIPYDSTVSGGYARLADYLCFSGRPSSPAVLPSRRHRALLS